MDRQSDPHPEPVHDADPRNLTVRRFLQGSYWNRAELGDQLKNFAEAAKDWGRAIEMSTGEEQRTLRAKRATSRLNAGQVAEAVADVAELTKPANITAGQWYNFACVYSVASGKITGQKQEFADRAMELLRQAVLAGYKDAAHARRDKNLDPLREREDFKKLVADLEKKSPPKREGLPLPRADK